MTLPRFPDGFLWGVSSSAHQVEGGADRRGKSTWDTFAATPGKVLNADTGQIATDHYHRYPEDVALMAELGVGAYRFSISWPRVLPTGSGEVNQEGLDFYDRLVDELCAKGIAPSVTLYHWDTPQPVEDAGGWLNRDTAFRFADYAETVVARLGDRVRMWMPLNEPMVVTLFGYAVGAHAPGRELMFEALPVAHHQLLAHGLATRVLRAGGAGNIGIANHHVPVWPASGSPADRGAADLYDGLVNDMFAAPVLTGRYPTDELAAAMPGPVAEDLEIISTPLDWYGVNYYLPSRVAAPGAATTPAVIDGAAMPDGLPFDFPVIDGYPVTDFGWPVVPDGLCQTLTMLADRYGDRLPPVYITENGCAYHDEVHDERRIEFLDGHLRALHRSIADGIDVRGYFVWSIVDNFEWAAGYSQRFGLVHVDFDTLARTKKDSFHWYRDLIKAQS
ncbi:GH1 family beta-glucosidase [Actinophytocola algeriensis]|uniref:Beta-glucosidase n=1 Tax=Actinophytocola algeriensis TaxID=1768010 RepID=A0A7W7VDL6_9PSEU|nr:GH1 family beta-glucosidase [Actinophytocola algeriensis]MBB4906343.1 beta-glucosidase [Actinophytocola algeriensis]MBE1477824.1 beta-glucosidase [Actinophytocola algeriensis]